MIKIYKDEFNDEQFITTNNNQLLDYIYKNDVAVSDIRLIWDNGEVSNEALLN